MPRIEILNSDDPSGYDPIYSRVSSSFGTVVKIDGQEIGEVKSVQLRAMAGDVIRADVELGVSGPLALDLMADVHVHLVVPPNCQIIETTSLADVEAQTKRYVVSSLTLDGGQ